MSIESSPLESQHLPERENVRFEEVIGRLREVERLLGLGVSKEELIEQGFGPELKFLKREGKNRDKLGGHVRLWIRQQQKWEEKEINPHPHPQNLSSQATTGEPAIYFNEKNEAMYTELFHTAERVAHALREQAFESLVDFAREGEYSKARFLDAAQMQQTGDKFEEDLFAYLTKRHEGELLESIAPMLLRLENSTQMIQELKRFRERVISHFESPVSDVSEIAGGLPQKEETLKDKAIGVAETLAAALALRFLSKKGEEAERGARPERGVMEGI